MSAEQLLSAEVCQDIDTWVAKYPADQTQSAVIPALHIVQRANQGSLTKSLIKAVADYLKMPEIAVFEVATFYKMFELSPVGKHKICLCNSISCHLMGSGEIGDYLQKKLGIGFGETTADGKFTLQEAECLGACKDAPVVHLNQQYHERLTPEKVDQLLDGLE